MTEKENKKIKIIIADDHAVVRRGLVDIISETPDLCVVAEVEDGVELLDKIRDIEVDLVVMDIAMPKKSGWDVMVQLKVERPKLPVIVLSIYPEEDYAIRFIKAGASGYLTKTSASKELIDAIRVVSKGKKYFSHSMAEQMALHLTGENPKKLHETLSPREFQVLCMLAAGKTVKEIAEELYLSIPTVNTHRARILGKMNLKNNVQLANYAFQNKLV